MAEERGLECSPFVVTLKHVIQLDATKPSGFCFVYVEDDVLFYDHTPSVLSGMDRNHKPARFYLPALVEERLRTSKYTAWYFYDTRYLYPLQRVKPKTLLETFWFISTPGLIEPTEVVFDPGTFNLRKKPLMCNRRTPVRWYDRVT